jgi:hypothetical protein
MICAETIQSCQRISRTGATVKFTAVYALASKQWEKAEKSEVRLSVPMESENAPPREFRFFESL